MKLFPALPLILVALGGPALADEPLQQGRSVAVCSNSAPVCAYMKDGHARETDECQARRDQAVRTVPGACWDED